MHKDGDGMNKQSSVFPLNIWRWFVLFSFDLHMWYSSVLKLHELRQGNWTSLSSELQFVLSTTALWLYCKANHQNITACQSQLIRVKVCSRGSDDVSRVSCETVRWLSATATGKQTKLLFFLRESRFYEEVKRLLSLSHRCTGEDEGPWMRWWHDCKSISEDTQIWLWLRFLWFKLRNH